MAVHDVVFRTMLLKEPFDLSNEGREISSRMRDRKDLGTAPFEFVIVVERMSQLAINNVMMQVVVRDARTVTKQEHVPNKRSNACIHSERRDDV